MTEEIKQNDDNQDVFKQTEEVNTNVFEEISKTVGKNYSDKDAVIKALQEKDNFIEQLKNENQTFGEKLDKVLNKLDESRNAESVLNELTKKEEKKTDDNTSQAVDEDKIASLIQEHLTKSQRQQTAEQNLRQVNDTIRKHFGDNAAQTLKQKAASLGMSVDRLKEIASESPTAAFNLLGISSEKKVDTTVPPTKGSSDIPSSDKKTQYQEFKERMAQQKVKPGTPRYYRELMKVDIGS